MKPIYLDHNATTEMEQGALNALLLFSSTASSEKANFGNPSSLHWAGRRVKNVLDDARESLSNAFGFSDPDSFFFTGSATEAINTALKGSYYFHKSQGKRFQLITTLVEHEATLESANFLEIEGARVHRLPVDENGELSLEKLESLLKFLAQDKNNAILLSLMAANNETGVIFPVREAVLLAKLYGATVHVDAVQVLGKSAFSFQDIPADMASFSAHKIGGPKGVGALYAKRGTKLVSLLHGGAQERKRRAGTENIAGIAAFAAAAELLKERPLRKMEELRQYLEFEVRAKVPGAHINGGRAKQRLVNTSNFLFDGVRGEALLMGLDVEGFAVSSGSACNSGSILPSHVLLAMGLERLAAASALRVSLGPRNTQEEIDLFVKALARVVVRIRESAKVEGRSR